MPSLEPASNPIVVNLNTATTGSTRVTYTKGPTDELWHRTNGGPWIFDADPRTLPGFMGAVPTVAGSFRVTLRAGRIHEIAVFAQDRGPLGDPLRLAYVLVFAIAKQPKSNLIVSEDSNTGGTWHSHMVATSTPTRVVVAEARRRPPTFNADGFPRPGEFDGDTPLSLTSLASHSLMTLGLLPGTPYTYVVVVIDNQGKWDFRATPFQCLRRRFTVQFTTLHIHNDGDKMDYGEARFHCRVMFLTKPGQPKIIEEFFRPEDDVDDWSKTDRPYPLGFAHVGNLEHVKRDEQSVWVSSFGYEDDWPLSDEAAWSRDERLPFPVGPGEDVPNSQFRLDCPNVTSTAFHFSVDIQWSVKYEP
jgi:hypothetical protein